MGERDCFEEGYDDPTRDGLNQEMQGGRSNVFTSHGKKTMAEQRETKMMYACVQWWTGEKRKRYRRKPNEQERGAVYVIHGMMEAKGRK